MTHAQKPDFVFRRNRRVHLHRRGSSVQSTTGSRVVRISGSNAAYTMFRGSVKGTGYPLHSPVSSSLPFPCVTVCHYISTGVYTEQSRNKTLISSRDLLRKFRISVTSIFGHVYVRKSNLETFFQSMVDSSLWSLGLRHGYAAARWLGLRVLIQPVVRMSVCLL